MHRHTLSCKLLVGMPDVTRKLVLARRWRARNFQDVGWPSKTVSPVHPYKVHRWLRVLKAPSLQLDLRQSVCVWKTELQLESEL